MLCCIEAQEDYGLEFTSSIFSSFCSSYFYSSYTVSSCIDLIGEIGFSSSLLLCFGVSGSDMTIFSYVNEAGISPFTNFFFP
jgi:hypothetical protein